MAEKTLSQRIQNIPQNIYYIVLIILLSYVLVYPLSLPISVADRTMEFYDLIESVPENGVILLEIGFDAGSLPELGPLFVAVGHQLMTRPVRVLVACFLHEGPLMYQMLWLEQVRPEEDYGKEYGEDWMFYGFSAGSGTTVAEMAMNMRVISNDHYGNPVAELPIMEGVEDYTDVDLVITFTIGIPGGTGSGTWVQYWKVPFEVPLAVALLKMMEPAQLPVYGAGQMDALVAGAGTSAEYELLVGKPADGIAMTDALSMSHLVVIVLVILGNIGWVMDKQGGKKI